MTIPTERLLEFIAEQIADRVDLVKALGASDLPGAQVVADRLEEGAQLSEAIEQVVPAELAILLAGPCPDIPASALLVAETIRTHRERRNRCWNILAYPLLSFAFVFCGILGIDSWGLVDIPWMHVGVIVICAVLGGIVVPWMLFCGSAPRYKDKPWSGWLRHAQSADNWRKAGLILQWRLTEADAEKWCGVIPLTLANACLGKKGITHCDTMATVHQAAAQRSAMYFAHLIGVWVQVCGAAIAVLLAAKLWEQMYAGF